MKPAILLLFCCVFAFGQSTSLTSETKAQTPANSSDQKPKDNEYGLGTGARGQQNGNLDILSDTQGVDFGPYLQRIREEVKENWYHLIPASASMKRGKLAIEFAITKDGKIADMRLVASSGDVALDRPAWGSIAGSNPFPPLPGEFTGRYLALRFRFFYNPDKNDLDGSGGNSNRIGPVKNSWSVVPPPPSLAGAGGGADDSRSAGSGIVGISAPNDLQVPAGGAEILRVTVTGTRDKSVDWIVSGSGCAGPACGKILDDVYIAPVIRPNPPVVTLTALSKADPTKTVSITVHIVRPAAQTSSNPDR
jgi:TonB family protein